MAPPANAYVRGMVGTGDRGANIHPQNWKRNISMIGIAPQAPLTRLLMAAGSEQRSSVIHNWSVMGYQNMRGSVTDVYNNTGLSSAYSGSGVDGQAVYLKMPAADAKMLRPNDTILVIAANGGKVRLDVFDVSIGTDATTRVSAALLQDDSNDVLAETSLTWRTAGNAQPEGSQLPNGLFRDPTWYSNQFQIMMEACEFTGTELVEEERISPDRRTRAKKDAFERLMITAERSIMWGVRKTKTGSNGKPQRYMDGIVTALEDNVPGNIFNYQTDSDFASYSWLAAGMDFFDKVLLATSRFTPTGNKRMFVSRHGLLAISQLVRELGVWEWTPQTDTYGHEVTRLFGPAVTLDLEVHPLFSDDPALWYSGFIFEPSLIRKLHLPGRDFQYVKAAEIGNQLGFEWRDGVKEGWFGEVSLEWENLDAFAWVDGLGQDNTA